MPWEIDRDEAFEKALKGLQKRFPNAEEDILDVFKGGHPARTDPIPKFEEKLWKGRVRSSDARRGASGGFRVIYYWDKSSPNWCCLGTFYFKGDYENLPNDDLNRLFISVKGRFERLLREQAEKEKTQSGEEPDEGSAGG